MTSRITSNGYVFLANTLKAKGYEANEDDIKNCFEKDNLSKDKASTAIEKYIKSNNSDKELSKEDAETLNQVLSIIDGAVNQDDKITSNELSQSFTYDPDDPTSVEMLNAKSGITIPIDDNDTGTYELVYDSDGNPKVNVYNKDGKLLKTRNVRPGEIEKFNEAGANIDTSSNNSTNSTGSTSSGSNAKAQSSTGLASPKDISEIPDGLTLDKTTLIYTDKDGNEYVKTDWADIGNSKEIITEDPKDDSGKIYLYLPTENGENVYVGFRYKNSDGTTSNFIVQDQLDALKQSSTRGAEGKTTTDAKIEDIEKLYQDANDEQGIIGKGINFFKNLFYTENSESKIKDEIAAIKERAANGEEISQEEIDALEAKIETYRNNSDKQVTNVAGTGAAIAGAALGAKVGAAIGTLIPIPIVGTIMGGAVGAIVGGFLVGGATKVAIEQVENMTDKVKGNSWQNDEDLGKQFITGGATGGFAAITAGIAGKIQGAFGKLFGLGKVAGSEATVVTTNGVVNTGKTVLAHAVSKGAAGAVTGAGGAEVNYIAECIADEEQQFNLGDALAAAGTGAAIGGAIGTVSGAVSGAKNVNTYNKDVNPTPQTQTAGNKGAGAAAQTKNPFKRFGNWLKNKFGKNKNTQTPDNSQQTTPGSGKTATTTTQSQTLALPPAADPTLPTMDELDELSKLAISQNEIIGPAQPFYQCSALSQNEQYILGDYFNGQITNSDLAKDPTLAEILKDAYEKACDYWINPNR